ncbi:MAG: peptidylprolyl isomerase [Wenzhouxiangellaceae bacterium]
MNNRVVDIHYTLTNDAGEVLDSSEGRDPLRYLHGAGNIIKGLEQALENRTAGEELSVTIEPEDAYGVRRDELIHQVPSNAFQGVDQLEVGMRFQAQTENGAVPIIVTKVEGDVVTVDANHELAGERLHFAVKVEEVREASEEEIEHGHVH